MRLILIALALIVELALIVANNVNGHFNPPSSINFTPFLMLILPLISAPFFKYNYKWACITQFAFFLLNDFFIRKYSGGTHDLEGNDWIVMCSLIGFVLNIIVMSSFIRLNTSQTDKEKWIVLLSGVCTTIIAYFIFLFNYGVDTYYP